MGDGDYPGGRYPAGKCPVTPPSALVLCLSDFVNTKRKNKHGHRRLENWRVVVGADYRVAQKPKPCVHKVPPQGNAEKRGTLYSLCKLRYM